MTKKVALDLYPIRVGEGGTGSGIWTYARELLHAMDRQVSADMEVSCFVNAGQLPYLNDLKNIRLIAYAEKGKSIPARLAWVHFRLPLACRRHRVDVLHKLATDTPWFCSARRVTTVHDFYYEYLMEQRPKETIRLYERMEGMYFDWVTRICFRKSKAIIAVSNATREEAVRRYPEAAGQIQVIHHGASVLPGEESASHNKHTTLQEEQISRRDNGDSGEEIVGNEEPMDIAYDVNKVNPSTINQQRSTDLERRTFRILCVAKFMEHKGQHLLIEAFERLMDQHPELAGKIVLRLRGFHNDADYYARICRQIEQSQYEKMINLEQFNASDSIESIYAAADLLVLLSDYEGFGLPVLEAQALGIPVLCSDLPVLREVSGAGAVYVKRTDRRQVAEALYRFVNDTDWRELQCKRARENPVRFSWDEAARLTLAVYRGVIS